MPAGEAPRFRRRRIRHAFNRAAPAFSGSDFLYREMARRMGERLDMVRINPRQILDAGCGLGADRSMLGQRYPEAQWLGIDSSGALLAQGQIAEPHVLQEREAVMDHRVRCEEIHRVVHA